MESDNKFDLKVGLFVTIGIALLLSSILLVGGNKVFLTNYSHFRGISKSSQGLVSGSVISLSGIQVGNVSRIVFSKDSDDLVIHFDIEKQFASKITTASRFSIKTQGALGDKYVFIDSDQSSPRGVALTQDGIIKNSSNRDIFDVISDKSGEFGEVADIVVEIHKLLLTINEENRSQKLMNNLVNSSSNLNLLIKETRNSLNILKSEIDPKELGATVHYISSVMKKIDNGDGSLGALINDSSLHNSLLKILGTPERNKYLKPLIRRSIEQSDLIKKKSSR